MKLAIAATLLTSATAFAPTLSFTHNVNARVGFLQMFSDEVEESINRQVNYEAGKADTEFARRFGSLSGQPLKTVADSFAEFTAILGCSINALYKNTITDLVGQVHLIAVSPRFKRDAIWSLGLITVLETLLKNYPEKDTAAKIISALIEAVGMDEKEVRSEAQALLAAIDGKSAADIEAALSGSDSSLSIIADIGSAARSDEYWQYSKFFGLGLVKVMEVVGVEQTMEESYATMEKWMKEDGLSKSSYSYTATQDSDQWFKMKGKLDMMETLMKEIEIREKKRMADRLEEQAELALKRAQREKEMDEAERKEKEMA